VETGERSEIDGVRDRLRAFSDGDQESFSALVSRYLQVTAGHLEELGAALSSGDAGKAEHAAHSAKGPCEMFGAVSLSSVLRDLEKSAARRDLSGAAVALRRVHREFARIKSGLI
jgi:histidine phosphotransfer protein HptB